MYLSYCFRTFCFWPYLLPFHTMQLTRLALGSVTCCLQSDTAFSRRTCKKPSTVSDVSEQETSSVQTLYGSRITDHCVCVVQRLSVRPEAPLRGAGTGPIRGAGPHQLCLRQYQGGCGLIPPAWPQSCWEGD